ncbi:sensor histidine kinase [Cryobacterium sp. TMT3-29-2]|uniref:sensor histidine kinase n=1 Tax=Cryobacterium sp. TMT3-29-2 TaxID=2555867 RepID=UPI0021054E99|nr:histidine kinase [Cryobacterium sp. TMT3-29-2]
MDKGTPGTQRHQRWATAVQKCLPPSVKTTAANGQSDIPTPVSLELPLTQERARIAREMHDIVAHSLAVIVTQAQSGELVAGKSPERAATVLGTIAATGRVALADMRRLLGMLRAEGSESSGSGPQPSLADLPQLLNRVGATGLTVRRTDEGTARPVGSAVELTPFRLVQESLTNTLRHAGPGARADLRLAWNARELIVTVSDNGVARWHPAMPPGTG